jgi:class 3 adenylate cyclase
MEPILPQVLVTLVALGMALAFVSADRKSPTSRALAASLTFIGVAIFLNTSFLSAIVRGERFTGLFAIPESLAMIATLEWLLRVRRTVPAGDLETRAGDHALRLGQAAGALYGLLGLFVPRVRALEFLFAATRVDTLTEPGFWLFAAPVLFASLTGLMSTILLLRRRPERSERVRVLALALATPLLLGGFVLNLDAGALSVLAGELILLIGAVHYHVLQGQRGQFMSRFLSTQVADLVRARGMKSAMEQNYLEITVVVSDLRGFTAFAQGHPSSRVIQVLSDYYDAVGAVVADYGATIKDYAGDGILILVGAPLPTPDHGRVGLQLAHRVRAAAQGVTARWSAGRYQLGIGIGVASGFVTVGVIGSASRLEYTAVGPAVNLASRLCEQALDGEILVDARTRELVGDVELETREPMLIKGFGEPVDVHALLA